MQEAALEIASHVTHPVTAAVFAVVIAAAAFGFTIRLRKQRLAFLLAAGIIILGLAPLASSTFLQSRGIYRVRVIVLGANNMPVDDAHVTSSSGGEPKKIEGGWEFDIPPQTRPADGRVTLYALVNSAFLSGTSEVLLGRDFYPTATVKLSADTSAVIRGVVMNERHGRVAGATVSVAGYGDEVHTDSMGNFELPAHAANGQIVQILAQKDKLVGSLSAPAGRTIEVVIHH